MYTKKRGWLIFIAIIFIVAAVLGGLYLIRVNRYQANIKNMTFTEPNIMNIANGIYTGEYDADLVGAKVEVTIHSGTITNIKILEHKQERGLPAEKIVDNIISSQKIDVDAITGATNSSKVIKKAVENALQLSK